MCSVVHRLPMQKQRGTMYRSVIRIVSNARAIAALVLFLLMTACTPNSATSSMSPAISASNNTPSDQQIVDGFAEYEFPTPELDQAQDVLATGQVAAAGGEVAVGRVSQAAIGNVAGAAAEVGGEVPVVSGFVQQPAGDEPTVTQSGYRPIPTVPASEAVNAAVIAAQRAATGSMEPLVAVDRTLFIGYLRTYRDSLREMVYLADTAFASGSFACDGFRHHMSILDATPRQMSVPMDLQIANYHLQVAFEQTEAAFRPMFNYCANVAGNVRIVDVQPAETATNMFPTAQYALHNVYDAVLWVNGDSAKVRELYLTTRGKVADYNATLPLASNETCAHLNAQYESIVYSPMLSLPEGQVANTYQHYVAAINEVATGGRDLYQACGNVMNGGGVISAEMVNNAATSVRNGLNQIDVAITYLP